MSFWDEQAGYDIRSRKHPDYANAGRNMGGTTTRKASASDLVAVDGATRYVCPEGCGAEFLTMTERELHFITEHSGAAT